MQRQDQPILIVDESRIDLGLYGIALAVELRALVGNLHRVAFLVLSLVGDRVGFWMPFPRSGRDEARNTEGVADGLDLPKRIETVGLVHLLCDRLELFRALRGELNQQNV